MLQFRLQYWIVHQVHTSHTSSHHICRLVWCVVTVMVLTYCSACTTHYWWSYNGIDVVQITISATILVQCISFVNCLCATSLAGYSWNISSSKWKWASNTRVHILAILDGGYISRIIWLASLISSVCSATDCTTNLVFCLSLILRRSTLRYKLTCRFTAISWSIRLTSHLASSSSAWYNRALINKCTLYITRY